MEKTLTQKALFNLIIEEVTNYDTPNKEIIINGLKQRLEQLEKKSASRKPSKEQVENDRRKNIILEVLESVNEPITIANMQDINEELAQLNTYSIVGLLTTLKRDDKVVRTEFKGKSYYSINKGTPTLEEVE